MKREKMYLKYICMSLPIYCRLNSLRLTKTGLNYIICNDRFYLCLRRAEGKVYLLNT